jgi:hypothetical protein
MRLNLQEYEDPGRPGDCICVMPSRAVAARPPRRGSGTPAVHPGSAPAVCERHSTRIGHVAPADQSHIRDGVMGGAKRAGRDQGGAVAGAAGNAVNPRGLNRLGEGHGRQDGGESAGQHRLARPWGTKEEDIVTACKLSLCNHIEGKIVPIPLYRDVTRASPDALNTMGELFTLPDGLLAVGIHVCYNGPRDAGEAVLRPLRAFRPLLVDLIRPMVYTEVNTMFDAQVPPGRRNYVKTLLVTEITDDAIDTLVAHFATVLSPLTIADFQQVGNAARRVGAEATPFCHRDAQYEFFIHAIWLDPAEDEAHIRWTRALFEKPPFQTGCSYINHMGREFEEGAARIRAAFGPNYERLVALKHKYDPTNLFRHNQNIQPTV